MSTPLTILTLNHCGIESLQGFLCIHLCVCMCEPVWNARLWKLRPECFYVVCACTACFRLCVMCKVRLQNLYSRAYLKEQPQKETPFMSGNHAQRGCNSCFGSISQQLKHSQTSNSLGFVSKLQSHESRRVFKGIWHFCGTRPDSSQPCLWLQWLDKPDDKKMKINVIKLCTCCPVRHQLTAYCSVELNCKVCDHSFNLQETPVWSPNILHRPHFFWRWDNCWLLIKSHFSPCRGHNWFENL